MNEETAAGPMLASLRGEGFDPTAVARRRFELAALEASGEVGYRKLTVQRILDRAALSRPRFYRSFHNRDECYAQAYAAAIEAAQAEILTAGAAASDWLGGFRACLNRVATFAESDPHLARGLFAEVHVAGGAALAKRKEVFERLSRAVDSARRETPASRHSPPPITASFILCAVEEAVVRTVLRGSPAELSGLLPELVYLAAVPYFGRERALAELEAI